MRLVHRGARLGGAATALLAALAAGAGAQNSNPTTSSASVLTGLPTSTCSDSKTAAPSSTPMTATCSGSEDTFSATASATATAGKNGSIQAGSSVTGFVFPLAIAD